MIRYSTIILLCLFILLFNGNIQGEESFGYKTVEGPCYPSFPVDHGEHPDYRTEWWYYTGNLTSDQGRSYGFQLTFFRHRMVPLRSEEKWPTPSSHWRTSQIYIAHIALSDITEKRHRKSERVSRGALNLAGVETGVEEGSDKTVIFVKDWSTTIRGQQHLLKAVSEDFSLDLQLESEKPPVLHGKMGYSQKGSQKHHASCYYSFTRLNTKGTIAIEGKTIPVKGISWMDHEYSTAPLEPGMIGWDWFSMAFDDNTEMMIYLLKMEDGNLSPTSSGTYVGALGKTVHLKRGDIGVEVIQYWKSPYTGARYPLKWRLKVIPLLIDVMVQAKMNDQEMDTSQSVGLIYWEGSIRVSGKKEGAPLTGEGYMELTGYAGSLGVLSNNGLD